MSSALPGEHYCREHQGNHSHYDPKNCTVCRLQSSLTRLRKAVQPIVDRGGVGYIEDTMFYRLKRALLENSNDTR